MIPNTALFRRLGEDGASNAFESGLDFAAYTGSWFGTVPDYPLLTPVAGDPSARCLVSVQEYGDAPKPRDFAGALAGGNNHSWIGLEGEVIFVGNNERGLELEVACQGERVQLDLMEGARLLSTELLHRRVRAVGILESLPDREQRMKARVIVPSPDQLEIHALMEPKPAKMATGKVLTTAQEVRNLSHAEAGRGLPGKIRGVVTWSSPLDLILQDATGGIYIHYVAGDWAAQPRVGELWEIEGETDPGIFPRSFMRKKPCFRETPPCLNQSGQLGINCSTEV